LPLCLDELAVLCFETFKNDPDGVTKNMNTQCRS